MVVITKDSLIMISMKVKVFYSIQMEQLFKKDIFMREKFGKNNDFIYNFYILIIHKDFSF